LRTRFGMVGASLRNSVAAGLVMLVAVVAACGGEDSSVVEFQDRLDSYAADRNQCAADRECVLAYAQCPLSCYLAVRSEFKSAVEQKADELVTEYRDSCDCGECMYSCAAAEAVCIDGRCAAVWQ
jgi:hypothetical protein